MSERKSTAPRRRPRPTGRRRQSLFQRLRVNFFTGLAVVGPTVLTIYLVWAVVNFIDAQVEPLIPARFNPNEVLGIDVPGIGVVIFLVFTAVVGAMTKGIFGRQLVRYGESLVDRTPIVRSIYNAIKQLTETILSQSSTSFQHACLVEYPRRDIWAIGFVSTTAKGEVPGRIERGELMSVFLPTTPNPTSGFLLFVPREDVVLLDMSVEEAAKLVISAGLVVPPTAEERAAGVRPAPAAKNGSRNGKNGRALKKSA
ncbi:MAG: DUF502 domain-containing protein [Pseudomonadota bacterium]